MSTHAQSLPAVPLAPSTSTKRPERLRRGAHTPLFNTLAVVLLLAISSFVVLSPSPDSAILRAGLAEGATAPDGGAEGASRAALTARATTTAPAPSTTPPTTAAPSTAVAPTTTTRPATTTTKPRTSSTTARPATAPATAASTPTAPAITSSSRPTTTAAAPTPTTARKPRCEDFATQPEAQAVFDADPAGLPAFDGDGDGLACEQLPGAPRAPRCEDFATQPEAQAVFDADPAGLAVFDGDGDGLACEQLPGLPGQEPPPLPPVPTKAELVRPATRFYGVHTRQAPFFMGEVDDFALEAGKSPNLLMFFQTLADPYPADLVHATWSRGMLPMISLEPIIKGSDSGQPTLDDIIDGRYDGLLDSWATAIRDQGLPVALRIAHEMNGDWYTWAERAAGNEPGDFVKAWRHIHDRFVAIGATEVIWVWSVNRVDSLAVKTLGHLYPGDDYVDWVGVGGYYRQVVPGTPPSFAATFNMTLAELKRVAPDKPVVFTEVGAGTGETTRVQWINAFFGGLVERPEVFGFVWFNDIKSGGDWRIQYSAATTAAFAAGVADTRYGSGVPVPAD